MINPCYSCVDRVPGCHAKCDRYTSWKEHHSEIKDKIRDEKLKERDIDSVAIAAVEMSKR